MEDFKGRNKMITATIIVTLTGVFLWALVYGGEENEKALFFRISAH